MLCHQRLYGLYRQLAGSRHAGQLVLGGGGADVGVQSAGGRAHQLHRHGCGVGGVGCAQGFQAAFGRVHQRRVQRALVGAAGGGRIVAKRAGGRGAAPEMAGVTEVLANQGRAHGLAITQDQAAMRLVREDRLTYTGDHQRVGHAGNQGECCKQDQQGAKCFVHERLLKPDSMQRATGQWP